jgi:nucleolar protein 56
MSRLIAKSPIGFFAFSENGELLEYFLFDRNPSRALERFRAPLPADWLEKGREDPRANVYLREQFRQLAKALGFAENDAQLNSFLSQFGVLLSKTVMRRAIGRDKLLSQASACLDDVNRMSNALNMRIAEWFCLHYPEAHLPHNQLLDSIVKYGKRENWPGFKESTGIDLSDEDLAILRKFAEIAEELNKQQSNLERYVRQTAKQLAPNACALIDPLLFAKLMRLAGGMEKLAKLSASSIQLLGAEKALFRHLRQRKQAPPKYGIIFLSDWIQNAPEHLRGKVARALAAMLMRAVRIDFYSGRDESAAMRAELEAEIERIKCKG